MSPLFCIDPKCRPLLAWKHYNFSVRMINNIRQRELFKKKYLLIMCEVNTITMIFSELLYTCELKRKVKVCNTVKSYWAAYSKIKRRWPRKRLEWLVSVLPSLIFAMCKYCKHDVWYWIFYLFLANRLQRLCGALPLPHTSASAYHRIKSDENHTSESLPAVPRPWRRDRSC